MLNESDMRKDWPASMKVTPRMPSADKIGNVISLLKVSSLLPPRSWVVP